MSIFISSLSFRRRRGVPSSRRKTATFFSLERWDSAATLEIDCAGPVKPPCLFSRICDQRGVRWKGSRKKRLFCQPPAGKRGWPEAQGARFPGVTI